MKTCMDAFVTWAKVAAEDGSVSVPSLPAPPLDEIREMRTALAGSNHDPFRSNPRYWWTVCLSYITDETKKPDDVAFAALCAMVVTYYRGKAEGRI